eukprot:1950673-Rhodomonas_salina.1
MEAAGLQIDSMKRPWWILARGKLRTLQKLRADADTVVGLKTARGCSTHARKTGTLWPAKGM